MTGEKALLANLQTALNAGTLGKPIYISMSGALDKDGKGRLVFTDHAAPIGHQTKVFDLQNCSIIPPEIDRTPREMLALELGCRPTWMDIQANIVKYKSALADQDRTIDRLNSDQLALQRENQNLTRQYEKHQSQLWFTLADLLGFKDATDPAAILSKLEEVSKVYHNDFSETMRRTTDRLGKLVDAPGGSHIDQIVGRVETLLNQGRGFERMYREAVDGHNRYSELAQEYRGLLNRWLSAYREADECGFSFAGARPFESVKTATENLPVLMPPVKVHRKIIPVKEATWTIDRALTQEELDMPVDVMARDAAADREKFLTVGKFIDKDEIPRFMDDMLRALEAWITRARAAESANEAVGGELHQLRLENTRLREKFREALEEEYGQRMQEMSQALEAAQRELAEAKQDLARHETEDHLFGVRQNALDQRLNSLTAKVNGLENRLRQVEIGPDKRVYQ